MNVVAIIPAKGTSRRLPRKNIYPIWGMPMMAWAIKACQESEIGITPWVSSEDEEIQKVARELGAKVHVRDPELSDHITSKQAVIRSAAQHIQETEGLPDIILSVQPNSPQLRWFHLDEGIRTLFKYERDEVFSVGRDLQQNAAFRVFRGEYVFQLDLSTNCGVYVCDLMDVHDIEDVKVLENAT